MNKAGHENPVIFAAMKVLQAYFGRLIESGDFEPVQEPKLKKQKLDPETEKIGLPTKEFDTFIEALLQFLDHNEPGIQVRTRLSFDL